MNNYVDLPLEGAGVTSLNGQTGALTLLAGANITITPGAGTLTIAATGDTGVASINADTTAAQTLTIGTTGTDFAIVDNGTGDHKFNLPTASAANRGALSSTDWSTFNGKQAAGNYITALTGDVTATGPGSVASTIAANVVTNAKLAQMPTLTIKGNNTGGTANALDLTVSQVNTMLGNSGDLTLAAFGSTPNANGASLSAQVLTLQPASTSFPGGVSTTTQSFVGAKTFTSNTAVAVASTTALVLNTTSFIFDTTNGTLGIGVQPQTTTTIDMINTSGAAKPIQMTGYGTSSTAVFRGRFARGTVGSPTAAQSGDLLGTFSARGYGATGFTATSTGVMNVVAGETFTDSSALTYLQFLTTPTGSATAVESARITSTGATLGPQGASTAIHTLNGGIKGVIRTITGNLTVDTTTTDYIILCNNSGAINVTLPTPTSGRILIIKDKAGTAATNNVTIVRNGSERIEGLSASYVLQTNFGGVVLTSDGTDWYII